MNFKRLVFLCLVTFALSVSGLGLLMTGADTNLYGQQAIAFMHGRADLLNPPPGGNQDMAEYGGRLYSPFPPAPAFLLLPLIAVFGPHVGIGWLILPLATLSAWMMLSIFESFADQIPLKHWLVVGFVFGTGVWTVALFGFGVWQLAECVGVFFVILALFIAYRWHFPLRSAAIGLALGMAFLSRQFTILLVPYFLIYLWNHTADLTSAVWRERLRRFLPQAVALGIGLGVGVVIYLVFNGIRFGNLLDTGYDYINSGVYDPVKAHGLFSLSYVPFNLMYYLFQGFHAQFGGADFRQLRGIDPFGTGILVASPFLVAAFYARLKNRGELVIAWAVITVMILSQLVYHNNGYAQLNTQRFSLDYLPLLMVLVGLGASRLPASLIRGMVIWAVLLNCIALYIVLTVGYTHPIP